MLDNPNNPVQIGGLNEPIGGALPAHRIGRCGGN
jgi:hypothetical protein